MTDSITLLPRIPGCIGVAADHGGFELKEHLAGMLREAGCEVIDFGVVRSKPDDDYPDFVIPLAREVTRIEVERGIAGAGSKMLAWKKRDRVIKLTRNIKNGKAMYKQKSNNTDLKSLMEMLASKDGMTCKKA